VSTVPVIVGVGQVVDRPDDPGRGLEPLALMEAAGRQAASDARLPLLDAVDTLAVVSNVFHDYGDPAALLATRLGCRPAHTLVSTWGGNSPQALLAHLADRIAAGRSEIALMAGGEAVHTLQALERAGRPLAWTAPRPAVAPRFGDDRSGSHPLERAHGAALPTVTFALVESALRAARGQSLDAARAELGTFGARCSAVAAGNPCAWFPIPRSADEIVGVTARNRMVAFPYPKFLNAIMAVNQGAAVVLASEQAADRLGVPRERRVYPWAGVDVNEIWYLLERPDYHSLPGVRWAGQALAEATGLDLAAVEHLDLYSCFPSAPRLVASMLGIEPDDPRPFTLAGGLPWFGGPGNNYTTHAVVALVERLRQRPGEHALVHALGWNLSKHALGLYGTAPPPDGWQRLGGPALQARVDAQARPIVAPDAHGSGRIEAYTIVHDREGAPSDGIVLGRLDDARRFIAKLPAEAAVLADFEREEGVGRTGRVRHRDGVNVFDPA
jgi:acetyl-CoA C-acetyltransferase